MSRRKVDEIENDIRTNYGMLLNLAQCCQVLNCKDRKTVKRFMDGIPCVVVGSEKKFLAKDVAHRISAQMVTL